MGHKFSEITFTDSVKYIQEQMGSRAANAKRETGNDRNNVLGPQERAFITARDSFYIASVSETGWPYVQHRGGPAGFLRVLDDTTLGFADFSGNRQYISAGNITINDRVALFLMDYPNKTRLKILGRARIADADDRGSLEQLAPAGYRARIERAMFIAIEAFDWNCPQHITPRFSLEETDAIVTTLAARVMELEEEISALKGAVAS